MGAIFKQLKTAFFLVIWILNSLFTRFGGNSESSDFTEQPAVFCVGHEGVPRHPGVAGGPPAQIEGPLGGQSTESNVTVLKITPSTVAFAGCLPHPAIQRARRPHCAREYQIHHGQVSSSCRVNPAEQHCFKHKQCAELGMKCIRTVPKNAAHRELPRASRQGNADQGS